MSGRRVWASNKNTSPAAHDDTCTYSGIHARHERALREDATGPGSRTTSPPKKGKLQCPGPMTNAGGMAGIDGMAVGLTVSGAGVFARGLPATCLSVRETRIVTRSGTVFATRCCGRCQGSGRWRRRPGCEGTWWAKGACRACSTFVEFAMSTFPPHAKLYCVVRGRTHTSCYAMPSNTGNVTCTVAILRSNGMSWF